MRVLHRSKETTATQNTICTETAHFKFNVINTGQQSNTRHFQKKHIKGSMDRTIRFIEKIKVYSRKSKIDGTSLKRQTE